MIILKTTRENRWVTCKATTWFTTVLWTVTIEAKKIIEYLQSLKSEHEIQVLSSRPKEFTFNLAEKENYWNVYYFYKKEMEH